MGLGSIAAVSGSSSPSLPSPGPPYSGLDTGLAICEVQCQIKTHGPC